MKRVDFDATVDHLALTHIIKNKAEPATTRIKGLLEILSSYSFNLYYVKQKNVILSDFLSRQKHDDSNPHEIIHYRYYNIGEIMDEKYLVQTRSQAKSSGITLPEVQWIDKGISPNVQPEKQVIKPIIVPEVKGITQNKPRLGQGRAGVRRKMKVQPSPQLSNPIKVTSKLTLQHPESTVQPKTFSDSRPKTKYILIPQTSSGIQMKSKMISREIPTYPVPMYRPPLKFSVGKPLQDMSRKITGFDMDINIDIKENSPYQEGIISETYQRPDRSYFQEPQEIDSLINSGRLVQKYLLKQMDTDKILKIIQRKVLNGTHVPVTVKEIQAGYLNSPYFKDL